LSVYCKETSCTNLLLITPADLQTFYQKSIFNGKTHIQTQKNDGDVMDSKEYLTFHWWNTCFLLNIS